MLTKSGIRVLALFLVLVATIAKAEEETKSCSVLFCKEDAKKFIVFEQDGSWMESVRWLELSVKDGQAAAKLTIWKGLYKPSKPAVEIRTIAQIQSVPTADFTKTIDELQNTQTSGALNKK